MVVYAEWVVRRKARKTLIEFLGPDKPLDPLRKMPNQALIDLVKDVRGDGGMDVGMWVVFPERFENRSDSPGFEVFVDRGLRCLEFCDREDLESLGLRPSRVIGIVAKRVGGASADGTLTVADTGDQALFRIVE